ncbi:hypothetical protein K435DRAFT_854401 [Dendrothele bispora CBS 962.96]|uniref:Uncharacterized protein n=1 Tax=Dendrothele bispora (strain CBS 962.96) TaxID=1314807 RepID=A0A4S8MFL1_DENBC|nr:hypothetical protein K435DRAFT_854401 [Dendrothele bispora CBS 962.96]
MAADKSKRHEVALVMDAGYATGYETDQAGGRTGAGQNKTRTKLLKKKKVPRSADYTDGAETDDGSSFHNHNNNDKKKSSSKSPGGGKSRFFRLGNRSKSTVDDDDSQHGRASTLDEDVPVVPTLPPQPTFRLPIAAKFATTLGNLNDKATLDPPLYHSSSSSSGGGGIPSSPETPTVATPRDAETESTSTDALLLLRRQSSLLSSINKSLNNIPRSGTVLPSLTEHQPDPRHHNHYHVPGYASPVPTVHSSAGFSTATVATTMSTMSASTNTPPTSIVTSSTFRGGYNSLPNNRIHYDTNNGSGGGDYSGSYTNSNINTSSYSSQQQQQRSFLTSSPAPSSFSSTTVTSSSSTITAPAMKFLGGSNNSSNSNRHVPGPLSLHPQQQQQQQPYSNSLPLKTPTELASIAGGPGSPFVVVQTQSHLDDTSSSSTHSHPFSTSTSTSPPNSSSSNSNSSLLSAAFSSLGFGRSSPSKLTLHPDQNQQTKSLISRTPSAENVFVVPSTEYVVPSPGLTGPGGPGSGPGPGLSSGGVVNGGGDGDEDGIGQELILPRPNTSVFSHHGEVIPPPSPPPTSPLPDVPGGLRSRKGGKGVLGSASEDSHEERVTDESLLYEDQSNGYFSVQQQQQQVQRQQQQQQQTQQQYLNPTSPMLSPSPSPIITRGRESPFPTKPVLTTLSRSASRAGSRATSPVLGYPSSSSATTSAVAGTGVEGGGQGFGLGTGTERVTGLEARVKVRRYRDLYALDIPDSEPGTGMTRAGGGGVGIRNQNQSQQDWRQQHQQLSPILGSSNGGSGDYGSSQDRTRRDMDNHKRQSSMVGIQVVDPSDEEEEGEGYERYLRGVAGVEGGEDDGGSDSFFESGSGMGTATGTAPLMLRRPSLGTRISNAREKEERERREREKRDKNKEEEHVEEEEEYDSDEEIRNVLKRFKRYETYPVNELVDEDSGVGGGGLSGSMLRRKVTGDEFGETEDGVSEEGEAESKSDLKHEMREGEAEPALERGMSAKRQSRHGNGNGHNRYHQHAKSQSQTLPRILMGGGGGGGREDEYQQGELEEEEEGENSGIRSKSSKPSPLLLGYGLRPGQMESPSASPVVSAGYGSGSGFGYSDEDKEEEEEEEPLPRQVETQTQVHFKSLDKGRASPLPTTIITRSFSPPQSPPSSPPSLRSQSPPSPPSLARSQSQSLMPTTTTAGGALLQKRPSLLPQKSLAGELLRERTRARMESASPVLGLRATEKTATATRGAGRTANRAHEVPDRPRSPSRSPYKEDFDEDTSKFGPFVDDYKNERKKGGEDSDEEEEEDDDDDQSYYPDDDYKDTVHAELSVPNNNSSSKAARRKSKAVSEWSVSRYMSMYSESEYTMGSNGTDRMSKGSFLDMEKSGDARERFIRRVGEMYDESGREIPPVPPVPPVPELPKALRMANGTGAKVGVMERIKRFEGSGTSGNAAGRKPVLQGSSSWI